MRNIVELHDWHYEVEMACGGDAWRLTGKAFGHPNIEAGHRVFTSTPVSFDRENMLVTTASGRNYKLFECSGNLNEQIGYIMEDVRRGATLII